MSKPSAGMFESLKMAFNGYFVDFDTGKMIVPERCFSRLRMAVRCFFEGEAMTLERFFNTAGPVKPERHYCLPPLGRLNLAKLINLIDQEKYFVLHAPRQTGKTSCLLALMDLLNQEGRYRCLYVNVEAAQAAREDVENGIGSIACEIASQARIYLRDDSLENIRLKMRGNFNPTSALGELLTRFAESSPKPLVLLIDEIDSLVGDTLISVLRQLRAGYAKRPCFFPQSIILCGVRNVQDYRIHSSREKAIITGGSAFNVKAKSLRMGNFSQEEVDQLYAEHTKETGQIFTTEALEKVWELTYGQPWLVNALAYEACFEMENGLDRSRPIDLEMILKAKENLILRHETHLDQLVDKLQEERVRRVIEPILAGVNATGGFKRDDVEYVQDLGLIRLEVNGEIAIANAIYQEVIPRELAWTMQTGLSEKQSWYITKSGRLDMIKLLTAFQDFFQKHSEHWVERFQYKEAGPQLLLQAFLQRIVNGGGRIEREYGLGRMRTDLLVVWKSQQIVIELKIQHESRKTTIQQGLKQTCAYLERTRAGEGHLVIFDRDPEKSWDKKLFCEKMQHDGREITIWGM